MPSELTTGSTKVDRQQGRHRKHVSPEVQRWLALFPEPDPVPAENPAPSGYSSRAQAQDLGDRVQPPPEKPAWMSQAIYEGLVRIREGSA